MINPLRSVSINGRWFNYVSSSFREQVPLRNSSQETQSARAFSIQGKGKESFSISLALDNTYPIYVGSSYVGSTTWTGVSRLAMLKDLIGGTGASMPIIFITPYGATYSVVPTGMLDINQYNPDNPSESGMEFRVSLTLEST